jgi:hypothetical protein
LIYGTCFASITLIFIASAASGIGLSPPNHKIEFERAQTF